MGKPTVSGSPSTQSVLLGAELDRLLEAAGHQALAVEVRERLVTYVTLLAKWNRVWNLTAVREPSAMLSRHVLDALSLLPFVDAALDEVSSDAAFDLLDVGSGAGLPVLPLAICRPDLRCLSVERTEKKARFQRQVVLELGLEQVSVRAERIEDVADPARIVTSRAFTAPEPFLALAAEHVVPGGVALVMLGRAERMPGTVGSDWASVDVTPVSIPGEAGDRHIAVCRSRGA